ncbi:hypothetical protein PsorP6_006991 [Peronosclerospora sorghi]|uniref:Uncharacterized protein n=1 Tax=Peronosclerospora sorghi TaxID=230839 RepID=A0ACC0WBA4_9STRA|nr:hypothetical protein PsorP6_006991 [Peronosclerospora sorghi]
MREEEERPLGATRVGIPGPKETRKRQVRATRRLSALVLASVHGPIRFHHGRADLGNCTLKRNQLPRIEIHLQVFANAHVLGRDGDDGRPHLLGQSQFLETPLRVHVILGQKTQDHGRIRNPARNLFAPDRAAANATRVHDIQPRRDVRVLERLANLCGKRHVRVRITNHHVAMTRRALDFKQQSRRCGTVQGA